MEQADFSAGKGESAMGQNYFRIDDRLIHGQIVTAWCSHLNIQEIIAIDDTLAGNSMLQSIMLMGVPKQYKSSRGEVQPDKRRRQRLFCQ